MHLNDKNEILSFDEGWTNEERENQIMHQSRKMHQNATLYLSNEKCKIWNLIFHSH